MKRMMTWTGWLLAGVLLATTPVVAQAGDLITGKDVKNGSLTGKDLRRGSVGSSDVANGSLQRKDLAESARPPVSQVYELYAFETGPEGGPTGEVVGFADPVGPYRLVEAIDINLEVSSRGCHNGTGLLKLGDDVIAQYTLADDQKSVSLESGDTGSETRNLVFRFTCSDDGVDLSGGSVTITYQVTRRNLENVIAYEH